MSQDMWGYLTFSVGLFRLIFLTINGRWRPSVHLRALGAIAGVTIWASLVVVSALHLPEKAPSIAIYSVLTIFDGMALWWAAGDAKLADINARLEKETNVD